MSDRESGDDQPQGQKLSVAVPPSGGTKRNRRTVPTPSAALRGLVSNEMGSKAFGIMGDAEAGQFEIDVRPVVNEADYQRLMEASGGKPAHKVFVTSRTDDKKEKVDNGNVLEKIQYWYPEGQQPQGEQELATKMLQIQSKRFYLDVKQNRRGRFIKVAEIGADGRRSQIFLALSTAAEFRDHLSTFSDYYASLGPPNPENVPEDGKLKSEMMIKDNRRYFLDLKENSRGRFLRVSQTIPRGGPRSQIAIPAQGMIEFRDALTDLLEEFGTDDGGFKGELPEGRHMRVENKNFYFDIGQNNRGVYMRISEVKTNFRTAITVPEKSWARFRDIFADYCDKMKEGEKNATGGGDTGTQPQNK